MAAYFRGEPPPLDDRGDGGLLPAPRHVRRALRDRHRDRDRPAARAEPVLRRLREALAGHLHRLRERRSVEGQGGGARGRARARISGSRG